MLSTLQILLNLFFPPLGARTAAQNMSQDRFEYPIYTRAYRESLWGFGIGLLISSLATFSGVLDIAFFSELLTTNLFTYGLPLLIAIPWLGSMIGRGLGFYFGMQEMCHKANNSLEVDNRLKVKVGLLPTFGFMLLGDAAIAAKGLYPYFYSEGYPAPPSAEEIEFFNRLNDLGVLDTEYCCHNAQQCVVLQTPV